jgi:8-oxo-dGTP pyrophosphatase MutT (NUDIX family)
MTSAGADEKMRITDIDLSKTQQNSGAGSILISADTGNICLSLRASHTEDPNTWGMWGGHREDQESAKETAVRELEEESGYKGPTLCIPLWIYQDDQGFRYVNFATVVNKEFEPVLDQETQDHKWFDFFDIDSWPRPLHHGVQKLILRPEVQKTLSDIIHSIRNKQKKLTEKWSKKYKRSIDCNRPKGFSQRAHCQGRNKNESISEEFKLQEIQRRPDDPNDLDYANVDIDSKTRNRIKMLPDNDRFGYTEGKGVTFFTGGDYKIELYDLKPPTGGVRLVGYLALAKSNFPLPNAYRVANVGRDREYRGLGLGQTLYIIAMKLLGMTILADDTQTASARKMWERLARIPGVEISGYTDVSPRSWAKRDNPEEIYDDGDRKTILNVKAVRGQEIGSNQHSTYLAFPVVVRAGELQPPRRNLSIYSNKHPEEGGTHNGLFAKWRG